VALLYATTATTRQKSSASIAAAVEIPETLLKMQ